ncbi:MAG: DUF2461 domain-containing protein [Oscillospiraceae bacterium]|jgi:uncharacterized protein (TIGR02453 family)|nr:DUF2461 domain-containing protein [Oscillospiraceae bacterium]
MGSGFYGFPEEISEFFMGLRLNNNAAWFNEHRDQFERSVRGPMAALIESLSQTMLEIDPQVDCRPASAIARIRRDARYAGNMEPYREHLWFAFRRKGERSSVIPAYYMGISLNGVNWGCGFYIAPRSVMDALRAICLRTPSRVLDVIEDAVFHERFRLDGTSYKRMAVPAELDERLRSIWKMKDIYAERSAALSCAQTPLFSDMLSDDFRALAPFYKLLRDATDAASGSEAERIMRVDTTNKSPA